MEDVKVISSMDELFIYAQEVSMGAELLPIKLDGSFTVSLHIQGRTWDKRIDSRTAQYVISLQNAFDELLEEFAPETEKKELLVKVDNKEGSWASFADVSPHIGTLVGNMTDTQSFIAIMTGIAAAAGCFMWSRYQGRKTKVELEAERTKQADAQEETRQKEEEERTKQEALRQETLKEAINALRSNADADPERFASYERPPRTIAKTLEEDDTVQVNQMPDEIPAEEAKKCGPRRAPRSEETITYADGNYVVNSRRYDEGEVVLELEQGGITIKGYLTQFDDGDRAKFIESLDRHEKEETLPFSMDLQVNVAHTRKKLKHAVILGEGAPREGKSCKPLNQILGN